MNFIVINVITMLARLDINSDLGERDSSEWLRLAADMMPLITSVNIACGAHAGTPDLMLHTARLAARHGVAIGAHPGFRDQFGFGRIEQSLALDDIEKLIADQITALASVLTQEGFSIGHVKPHGALYNMAAVRRSVAQAVVKSVASIDPTLLLYALSGSVLAEEALNAGIVVVREAFADRAYWTDGTLVPRSEPGALLTSDDAVLRQLHQLLSGSVTSIDGKVLRVEADSICLHTDDVRAIPLAQMIRRELDTAGIIVAAVRHA